MNRTIFLYLFAVLISACSGQNRTNEPNMESEKSKLNSLTDGDSISYIGKTHYRKDPIKFDTTYFDTIKVFKLNKSLFAYEIKELKYMWLAPLPGEPPTQFSTLWLRDSFAVTYKGQYINEIIDGDFRSKVSLDFIGEDSLLLNDIEEDTADKIFEVYEFIGVASFPKK